LKTITLLINEEHPFRALAYPLGFWQSISLADDEYPFFYAMCDAIEGASRLQHVVSMEPMTTSKGDHFDVDSTTSTTSPEPSAPELGVGLNKALRNYAAWFKSEWYSSSKSATIVK